MVVCSSLSSSFFEYVCHRRVELPAPRWCWSPSLSYSAKPAAAEADSPKGTSSRPQDFLYNLWRVKVNLANGFIGAPVSFQNGCLGSSGKRLVILQNQHKNSKGGYIHNAIIWLKTDLVTIVTYCQLDWKSRVVHNLFFFFYREKVSLSLALEFEVKLVKEKSVKSFLTKFWISLFFSHVLN